MASVTISLPITILEELNAIDWHSLGYNSRGEWIRELVRRNLSKIKTNVKEAII